MPMPLTQTDAASEISERPRRRTFTAQDKLRILVLLQSFRQSVAVV